MIKENRKEQVRDKDDDKDNNNKYMMTQNVEKRKDKHKGTSELEGWKRWRETLWQGEWQVQRDNNVKREEKGKKKQLTKNTWKKKTNKQKKGV